MKKHKLKTHDYITIKAGSIINFGECVCDGGVVNKEAILLEDLAVAIAYTTEVEEIRMVRADTKNIYREMLRK